ncbi:protein containg FOG: WD40 repeat [Longilinea arvoryzae]|uniref:Protein containg FOG: WD40 repeat n=1 Tax=Longilinea arvoryzae TaxID=360412 RepID=A0A0S7BK14_9CHLR|nr:WD40 repeat domain-containing protein [Longilinea arvoryzae]GAP14546.1 protein containg FOG: WD40 repeat [Longilinea arvoryzae]
MPTFQDHYEQIKNLLSSAQPDIQLPADLQAFLLQAGAVQALFEDASEAAIGLLENSARACPAPEAARQAAQALHTLATQGNSAARESLYRLALEDGSAQAVEWIRDEKIPSPLVWQNRCFAFQFLPLPEYLGDDPHLEKLLHVYLTQVPPVLQEQLAARATKLGLEHWTEIADALLTATDEKLAILIDHYHGYTQHEKNDVRFWLTDRAQKGSVPTQNALCELFLNEDDGEAGRLAVQHGFQPTHPERRALFLFLTEQWDAYEVLDFTHQRLNAAYESAGPGLRQRILSHSRLSGHTEWLQSLGDAHRRRWLKDMSDADWRSVLRQFESKQDWRAAWRMITHAPPLWAAQLIGILQSAGWKPETQSEELEFLDLVSLANRALRETPEICVAKVLKTPALDISAVAMRSDGRMLATGGSDQRLYLWDLPSGERRGDVISSPVPGARALALSPDGEFLAAAFSDQGIRIYRIQDGHLVKTLAGHTGWIRSISIHPDGRTLFSASFDGTLRAWRFPLGPEYSRLQPNMGELFAAATDAAGDVLLLSGQQVQTWRWPQGEMLQNLPASPETTLQLALAADAPLLAGYSRDHTLRVWNYSSGRLLSQIHTPDLTVTALCLSPQADFILGGDKDGAITVWNTSTGEILQSMQVHEKTITGLHWFAGAYILSASQEGRLILWDARLLRWLRQPIDQMNNPILGEIQSMDAEKNHSSGVKAWLAFLMELIRWKNRFDIQLEEIHSIRLDEFDIEL